MRPASCVMNERTLGRRQNLSVPAGNHDLGSLVPDGHDRFLAAVHPVRLVQQNALEPKSKPPWLWILKN